MFVGKDAAEEALQADAPKAVMSLLRVFVQHLYDAEQPKSHYKELLLALQDRRPDWPALRSSWKALTLWQVVEPSVPHVPLPLFVWAAIIAAAILLGEWRFALISTVQYLGLLRPGEARDLQQHDFCFPEAIYCAQDVVFLTLRKHKTQQAGFAGMHHARLRDAGIIDWARRVLAVLQLRPQDPLWSGSPAAFRRKWDFICKDVLLLPVRDGSGYTPASLRAGAATELYARDESIVDIRWRLRHDQEKSGRHYLRESAAALGAAQLSQDSRARIETLAPHLRMLMKFLPRRSSRRLGPDRVVDVSWTRSWPRF